MRRATPPTQSIASTAGLRQSFENTRRMLAVLLEQCEDEAAIRRAVSAFRSYQVGGLDGFARTLVASRNKGG